MKYLIRTTTAAMLAGTAMANAGAIDRSGQSVDIIFEDGTYAELSFGFVSPDVSGTDYLAGLPTGDMGPSYAVWSGGFKTDFGSKFSAAVIFDQPFGADVEYPSTNPVYFDVTAELDTSAITGILSYDATENIVIYGGIKAQSFSADAAIPAAGYTVVADRDTGFGYVIGAGYQLPEYALRVSLTYQSEVDTSHDTLENGAIPSVTDVTTPQSVNLEFQTGINQKTLIFGSVRWVDWSSFELAPFAYTLGNGEPLVEYEDDRFTLTIGIGRKLTETLSGAITIGHESTLGGDQSALSPTDGKTTLGAGLTYTMGSTELTGGVQYLWLGDIDDPTVGIFEGNTAVAVGFKIAYRF